MDYDFMTALANLMLEDDSAISQRLCDEDELLEQFTCSDKRLGKWFEDFDGALSLIMETLSLPDTHFNEMFSDMPSFNRANRHAFADELWKHGETCERCKHQVLFNQKWEGTVKKSVFKHRKTIKEERAKEKTSSEADHSRILFYRSEIVTA